jgi:hypothetical protein
MDPGEPEVTEPAQDSAQGELSKRATRGLASSPVQLSAEPSAAASPHKRPREAVR